MVSPTRLVMLLSGSSAFIALYLLGASPSERHDWEGVSRAYVSFIRVCWAVSVVAAAVASVILLLKRRALRLDFLLIAWALVVFASFTLALVFTQYFRW